MNLEEYLNEVESKKLKIVDLIKYELEVIPERLFEFNWIEELYFGGFLNYLKNDFILGNPCVLKEVPRGLISLTNLKKVSFCGGMFGSPKCEISDFSVLGEIPSLEAIYLDTTNLKQIDFLHKLPHLKELQIGCTEIEDYSPIKELLNLESITLGDNNLSSLDILEQTTNLKAINLNSNNLKNLDSISKNKELKRICICLNDSINIDNLNKNHKSIEYLCCSEKQTLELILPLKNIKDIYITGVTTNAMLNKLKNHHKLEECTLSEINETEVDVSVLKSVKKLELNGSFKTVTGFDQLKELTEITLSSDSLKEFKVPDQLKGLGIMDCKFHDLNQIKNLENLETLWISSTEVKDLSPLKKATQLKDLDVQFNSIESIEPILDKILNGLNVDFSHTDVPEEVLELYEEGKFEELSNYYKKK